MFGLEEQGYNIKMSGVLDFKWSSVQPILIRISCTISYTLNISMLGFVKCTTPLVLLIEMGIRAVDSLQKR